MSLMVPEEGTGTVTVTGTETEFPSVAGTVGVAANKRWTTSETLTALHTLTLASLSKALWSVGGMENNPTSLLPPPASHLPPPTPTSSHLPLPTSHLPPPTCSDRANYFSRKCKRMHTSGVTRYLRNSRTGKKLCESFIVIPRSILARSIWYFLSTRFPS
jgi:hypothetical protein